MEVLSGEIADKVFRQVIKNRYHDISLERWLLKVFLEINGKSNVGEIAQKAEMDMVEMRKAISKLLELGLIMQVAPSEPLLDDDFFDYLQIQLSRAVGPIAVVLIEEDIKDMGHNMSDFPSSKAAELVDLLAREIQREEKKALFKLNMVNKIKEKKY